MSSQRQNGTGYGKPSFPKNIDSFPTLADLLIFTLDQIFLVEVFLNWPNSLANQNALVKIGVI